MAHRLAVYLRQIEVIEDLPPEQYYTTMKTHDTVLAGYVYSDFPLQATPEGAVSLHPIPEAAEVFTTSRLLRFAADNLQGLSWRKQLPHPRPQ